MKNFNKFTTDRLWDNKFTHAIIILLGASALYFIGLAICNICTLQIN